MKLVSPTSLQRHNGQQHFELSSAATATLVPQKAATTTFDFHTITWQADGFGFDATTGEFFTASPTALTVMQALGEGMDRRQILDRLTAGFEVTRSTAERDLEAFLAELVRLGLTEESR